MARNSREIKISGKKDITPASPLQGARKAPAPSPKSPADSVESAAGINVQLSQTSREIGRAQHAIGGIPDIRIEFITEIRDSIENGTYKRDSEVVARKIVNEFLFESIKMKQRRANGKKL